MKNKILFVMLAIIAITITLIYLINIWPKKDYYSVAITNNDNQKVSINAEKALTFEELQKGLMYREKLDSDKGMLFVFNKSQNLSFWMKNTYIPLDIIFIDENKNILNIKENAQPCMVVDCPNYSSNGLAKYVLEVNAGFCSKNNIKEGNKISFD